MSFYKRTLLIGTFFCFIFLISNLTMMNSSPAIKQIDQNTMESPIQASTIPLISDNFNNYADTAALAAAWTLGYYTGATAVTLNITFGHSPSKSVKLVDNSLTQRANLSKVFGSEYKYLYLSVWVFPTEINERLGIYFTNTSDPVNHIPAWVGPSVGFTADGKYLYQSAGTDFLVGNYIPNVWYHIEVFYDIQSKRYTFYANDLLLCENVLTQVPLISVDRVFISTSSGGGAGSAIFYVDDIIVRDRFIQDKIDVPSIRQDDFESYTNNEQLIAAGWSLEAGQNTNATLQSYPYNSHSFSKSVRLYDYNNTMNGLCDLRCSYSAQSFIYFRSYVLPKQQNGVLFLDILNTTGHGTYFAFW